MSVPTPILQYNLSDASVKGLLPSGYTPLAYIKFTNADRLINTGITSNNNLKFESKWGNLTNGGLLYGSENSSDISSYSSTSSGYNWRWGGIAPSPTPVVDTGIFIVELSKDGIKINGVTKSTYSGTPSFTNTAVYLFGRSDSSAYYLTGKCYYFKIWNNGSLVRDFIPCINSSNVVGLYDLVERLFYSPSSNVLIAGPELAVGKNGGKSLPEEYQLVEYLESHGNTNSPYLSFTNRTLLADDIVQINTSLNRKNNGTLPTWLGGSEVLIFILSGNLAYWRSANVEAVSPSSGTSITLNLRYIIKSKIKKTVDTWGLFAYSSGSYPIDGKIEMISVTRGSSVILKLIPCYRKSDMKPGMYDVVNGEFKTSAASGEFILGPSITNCYTSESNAGSETLQGLYTNISGVYDSSKGWVADFNGSNSRVYSSVDLVSIFNTRIWTISFWFNTTNLPTNETSSNWKRLFIYRKATTSDASTKLLVIYLTKTEVGSSFYSDDNSLIIPELAINTWYHLVVTQNGTTATFYINGLSIGTTKKGTLALPTGSYLLLGYDADKNIGAFNGKLQNVQVWDSVLTAEQVKELYGK